MATLFANGSIHQTGVGSTPGAVLVDEGRIIAIGERSALRGRAGRRVTEVDLEGGLLSPSFTDAHLHPMMGGAERSQCNLGPAISAEDCFARIRDYDAMHPDEEWIVGGGWRMDLFPGGAPTRDLLDAIVPSRPVILISADRHSSWVNTVALQAAGITADTPDPSDGRIEREPDGSPSGLLHEGASGLVRAVAPQPGLESNYRGLLVAQDHCFELGITGWQDALVRIFDDGTDALDVYFRALEADTLKAKVTAALWWDRHRRLEQIDELNERRAKAARWDPRFRADAVKIALDGIMESFTASLTRPYHDGCGHETDNSGLNFLTREDLIDIVRLLDQHRFQVHFHALGDQAVRNALDALEDLPHDRDLRHHLAHLQVIQSGDIERFRRLSAVANLQPLWAQNEPAMLELTIPFLHPDLARRQYPFGDLHRAGVGLAGGSDWPVSSADPIEGIHVAVNRSAPETAEAGPLLPEQAIDLVTAWDAYTSGSARVNHREDISGTIRVGAAADLITVDRDPFANAVEEIASANVTSTWIDGEQVWRRSDA